MAAGYTENPSNFQELVPYVIFEKEQIFQELILAEKCYFYDACAFRRHVQMVYPEYIFDFIKGTNGITVITRGILMELGAADGLLRSGDMGYLRRMYEAGIKIIILYEEDLFGLLSICFSTYVQVNSQLSWAVKAVKRPTGTVAYTLNTNDQLKREILSGARTDKTLFARFFQEVRKNKMPDDDLGEELLAVCMHLLANIPESVSYKYIIFTDDRSAVGMFNKTRMNILNYIGARSFSVLTTNRLVQRLYEIRILTEKLQIEEMLKTGISDEVLRIFGSEKYDLRPEEKRMTAAELAEKIVGEVELHINY